MSAYANFVCVRTEPIEIRTHTHTAEMPRLLRRTMRLKRINRSYNMYDCLPYTIQVLGGTMRQRQESALVAITSYCVFYTARKSSAVVGVSYTYIPVTYYTRGRII